MKLLVKAMAALTLSGALCFAAPTAAHAQENVPVTSDGMTVDSFQGIDANYITGTGNSNTGDYCCAGYVIKFYKELYDVDAYYINMNGTKPVVTKSGHDVRLETVDIPKPGDMMQNLTYSHVGIVKRVEDDKVILIEQNYKYAENGQTVAVVEREISLDEAYFYRLVIDGKEQYFEDESNTVDLITVNPWL